jgi:hypothetical protein
MTDVTINWVAVAVATVAQMVCGFLWYGPLFGKKWMQLVGKTEEEVRQGASPWNYVISIATGFVVAISLSCVIDLSGATTLAAGIKTAFFSWLGFTAMAILVNDRFEGRSCGLTGLNLGFHLLYFCVQGAILAVWQ